LYTKLELAELHKDFPPQYKTQKKNTMNPPATATAASLVRAPLLLRLFALLCLLACKLQEFFVFGASQSLLNKF
jgi:hypothetical protein